MAKTWKGVKRFVTSAFANEQDHKSDDPVLYHPYKRPTALKWAFCTARVGSTLVLLPVWALEYKFHKKVARPSWTVSEAMLVDFTRRVQGITELAGVQHGTRNVLLAPTEVLKETRFEWHEKMFPELVTGVLADEQIKPLDRVGTFVWERHAPGEASSEELEKEGDKIGIYFHGGGYSHFSAHENAQTSIIPRRLMESNQFGAIYAVEYRLLPNPFPAALQDAATVYCDLVLRKHIPPEKIVIIGDSAGGNVALALARWIREEQRVGQAGGMILLSPWCDPADEVTRSLQHPAHSFPETVSSYIPRPNPEDYLADEPAGRILLVANLLGHHPREYVTDPYISPASQLGPAGCFDHFPPTFIHYGDAERLQKEIEHLIFGMKRDGVPTEVEMTADGVHDLLMVRFWNEEVRSGIYSRIERWLDTLGKGAAASQGTLVQVDSDEDMKVSA